MSHGLPDVDDPVAHRFWAAAGRGRLACEGCGYCGALRWPPRNTCPECLRPAGGGRRCHGRAVWSVAVYDLVFGPAFGDDVP